MSRPVREWRPIGKDQWDKEYASGDWDYLRDLDELAHYSIIVGYFAELKPGGSVLDVGCGEGSLKDRLALIGYERYLGIDISEAAIELARSKCVEGETFLVADAAKFKPDASFDVVIFNECLNYFKSPIDLLHAYSHHVNPNGFFLISMWGSSGNDLIWREIQAVGPSIDRVRVENAKGTVWNIAVVPPLSPPGS